MSRILTLVLATFFSVISSTSHASDFFWAYQISNTNSHRSDPLAACMYYFTNVSSSETRNIKVLPGTDETNKRCQYEYNSGSPTQPNWAGPFSDITIYRGGTSCPTGSTYNDQTGICEQPNLCAQTEGRAIAHMFLANTRSNPYDPWPSGEVTSPTTVCSSGCRYSAAGYDGNMTCGTLTEGDKLQQYCIRGYLGQGVECQSGDPQHSTGPGIGDGGGDSEPPPSHDPNDPTDPANNCPRGYVWTGTTCAKVFNEENPTTPTPPGSGGGSGGGSGDGSGDGSGNGDGDGSGDGGTGGTGGTGGGGGGTGPTPGDVAGTACSQALTCTGDAYQCAILYHQKEASCNAQTAGDFNSAKKDIEGLVTGDEFNITEEEVAVEGIIGQGTRFLPSSCPAPQTLSLSGASYQWSYEPLCGFASDFRPIFLAVVALFCALYIGRAFGGE